MLNEYTVKMKPDSYKTKLLLKTTRMKIFDRIFGNGYRTVRKAKTRRACDVEEIH